MLTARAAKVLFGASALLDRGRRPLGGKLARRHGRMVSPADARSLKVTGEVVPIFKAWVASATPRWTAST